MVTFTRTATTTRTATLTDNAARVIGALEAAGYTMTVSEPYHGAVEIGFDNGGNTAATRFGVIVVSARSGKILRGFVSCYVFPDDRYFTETKFTGHRDVARMVKQAVR